MEPQAESTPISVNREITKETIQEMLCYMELKEILNLLEVPIPELVKYCPYTGSYNDMIKQAIKDKNQEVLNALLTYQKNMIERDYKLQLLQKVLKNNK